jgi:hypothetical protein
MHRHVRGNAPHSLLRARRERPRRRSAEERDELASLDMGYHVTSRVILAQWKNDSTP